MQVRYFRCRHEDGKTTVECYPTPQYVLVDGLWQDVQERYASLMAAPEQQGAESAGGMSFSGAKDDLWQEYQEVMRQHAPGLRARVVLDRAEPPANVRPMSSGLEGCLSACAPNRCCVFKPSEFVWVDGAENTSGVIVLPRDDYRFVFVAKGDYENPEIVWVPEGKDGDPRPYFERKNGETHVYVDSFSGVGGLVPRWSITQLQSWSLPSNGISANIWSEGTDRLIAVGHYGTIEFTLLRWNGTALSQVLNRNVSGPVAGIDSWEDATGDRLILLGAQDLELYRWNGSSLTQLSILDTPHGVGDVHTWEDVNGHRLIAAVLNGSFYPLLIICRWDGTALVQVASSQSMDAGESVHTWEDANGDRLIAVGHFSSPRFTLYRWNGASLSVEATFTIPGTVNAIHSWEDSSGDRLIAVVHDSSPCFTLLRWDGSNLTRVAETFTLPGTSGRGVYSWQSINGDRLIAVLRSDSPRFVLLRWDGVSLTEEGTFALPDSLGLGHVGIHAFEESNGDWLVAVPHIGGGSPTVHFTLLRATAPPPFIFGTVTLSGQPVQGAKVTLIDSTTDTVVGTTLTDVNGEYVFENLDQAKKYHVTVEHEVSGTFYNAESLPFVTPVVR